MSKWTGDAESPQIIAVKATSDAVHDWLPWPPRGELVTLDPVMEAARTQDALLNVQTFVPLCSDYLDARAALSSYERWLRTSGIVLLVLQPSARQAVREFLRAWQALVDAALAMPTESTEVIRDVLLRFETVWGEDEGSERTWCVLSPLHPYLLDPLLQTADYCLDRIGNLDIGTKVAWALDRSLPAYRILWTMRESLFLKRQDGLFEFSSESLANQPFARSGTGIQDVARSFLDYHPFAKASLSITLVDPPRGGAVAKNLQAVARDVDALTVNVVATRSDSSQLEQVSDAEFIGRFASVSDWLQRAPVRSHLTFLFAPRQPGEATAATGQGWGPTPGAHVAVQLSVRSTDILVQGGHMTPFVTFEPRDGNRVVVGLQQLSRVNEGTPRLFEIEPMLRQEQLAEFVALRQISDWAILCAPAPLGLVPSRDPGGDLVYIGRENLSLYGLFVYSSDLFSIRRLISDRLRQVPAAPPDLAQIEERIALLALDSSSGVLRMGHQGNALWEHIGLLVANEMSRGVPV